MSDYSPEPVLLPLDHAVQLSIVIVSWNVRDLLDNCLASIQENRTNFGLEVIVVDGGSADDSSVMVAEKYPWVNLLALNENVGFPKGNNIGLRQAHGRFILLLNPDTEILGNALTEMITYMDANQQVGILGAQLLNPEGSVQSSRRRFPSLLTGLFESTWLQAVAPKNLMANYYFADVPVDQIIEVDWLVGACLMARREAVEQAGFMDEAYFMYSEELDWCRRVKDAGWRIVYFPDAQIIHHIGKSSEQAVIQRHINFQRAKLRYFRKFHGRVQAGLLRIVLLINYLAQLILEGLKGLLGHKRPLRWQRMRAYWQVIRSGLKPAGY